MIVSKKILVICLVSVTIFGGLPIFKVFAEGPAVSDQQITIVRDNCTSTKSTLNQVHVSDAVLRVNMGQAYDSMSSKLMGRFNDRIASNKLNNNDLVSVTKKYNSTLDAFRLDYKTYEEQLSLALSINCSTQPADFYNAVEQADKYRDLVHADVLKLNDYIDQYQAALNQFDKDHPQTSSEGTK